VPKLFHDLPSKYVSLKGTMGMNGFITCDITYPFIPLVLAMGNILTNFKDRRLFSVISVIALSVPGLLRSGDFDL